jgi:general secretion pathway protein C
MLTLLIKYRQVCLLGLVVLLGLACGNLVATLLGMRLGQGTLAPMAGVAPIRRASAADPAADLAFILQHNLFDAAARSTTALAFSLETGEAGQGGAVRGDLELLGTVVAGSRSLALIRIGQELKTCHLGEEIPGGKIEEIVRHQVGIRNHNGSMTTLRMQEQAIRGARPEPSAGAARTGTGSAADNSRAATGRRGSPRNEEPPEGAAQAPVAGGVRAAGANRWVVERRTAEAARENIGEQLRTALLQPNLVDGKTDGFVVKRIRPGTLLAQMGLQPGDVIKRVNRMPLDSPEKALQIMQQLREARQLNVDLVRGGASLSFAYEIE